LYFRCFYFALTLGSAFVLEESNIDCLPHGENFEALSPWRIELDPAKP